MGPVAPYLGREHVLAALRVRVDEAFSGRGGLVLLAGEPGIGKTRTAAEISDYAQRRGAHVLWARCHEADGAPAFWPWLQILRAGIRHVAADTLLTTLGPGATDIAQLVPELRAQLTDLPAACARDAAQAHVRVLDSIARFLKGLTAQGPVVLVIDDLHGADPSSLRVLEFVAGETRTIPLLLLGTYRDGALPQDHPLTTLLAAVLRLPPTHRLTLTGLSVSETAQLVELSGGAPPAPALVAAIQERTAGNPLFVGEYARMLRLQGNAAMHSVPSAPAMAVPRSVRSVIERWLRPLSEGCRMVLGVAALIGREFAVPVVLAVMAEIGGAVADAEASVAAALDEALVAGVVTPLPDGPRRYHFGHPLLREFLYEELSATRRAHLHQLVGEALEAVATARKLEMELLIERLQALKDEQRPVVASQPAQPTPAPSPYPIHALPSATDAVFRCEGQYWTVAYAGTATRLKDSKGLHYLAHLLRHPGQEFLALDLAQGPGIGCWGPGVGRSGSGTGGQGSDGSNLTPDTRHLGPLLDHSTRATYKCRLQELREELGEAEANNDLGRCERCRAEMDMLLAQLRSTLGLGGRDRPVASAIERARSAVGKRIRAEIKHIRNVHPGLGRHLAATVSTGYFCAYKPDPDVTVPWEL